MIWISDALVYIEFELLTVQFFVDPQVSYDDHMCWYN